jgi:alkyl hydroperoxide reductase subunit AhpC
MPVAPFRHRQALGASRQPLVNMPAWMIFSHKVVVVSPSKQIRYLSASTPVIARNFAEILRIVQCLQQFEIVTTSAVR